MPQRSPLHALFTGLLLCPLLGCAAPAPPISECTSGRYHADCGGDGEPALGCDVITGECRWFLGGQVAQGYVATDCPSDNLCCIPRGEGRVWPFWSWTPAGEPLITTQADIGILAGMRVTSDSPRGVAVTYDPALTDYVPAGPLPFAFDCDYPELCGFTRWDIALRGESLVVTFYSYSESSRMVLEILPDATGVLHARLFRTGAALDFEWDRTALGCRFGGDTYALSGSMRLAPGSLDDLALAHGDLDVNIGPGTFHFRLRF